MPLSPVSRQPKRRRGRAPSPRFANRIRSGLAILLLLAGAPASAALGDLAQRFEHPERYRVLFERMVKRGIPEARVRAYFGSSKALRRDSEALSMRADPKRIPEHAEAEREANQRYLRQAEVLAEHLREHRATYRLVEERYRIRREIIGAILLKESALGQYSGLDHDAFVVFNTLYDGLEIPEDGDSRMARRASRLIRMAREQLIALAVFAYRRDIPLHRTPLPSSYAGAIGIPQWLPVHLPYAVTARDERPDLSLLPDAILSTANLIRNKLGWPKQMLDFARLSNLDAIVAAWQEFDRGRASFAKSHNADGQKLRRFDRARADMPNVPYLAEYVRALMSYNNSSEYALGVIRIANRAHRLGDRG